MAGHAEPSRLELRRSHWHTSRESWFAYPQATKSAVDVEGLERRRRAHSDPVPHCPPRRQQLTSSRLRHSDLTPVGAAAASAHDGTRPTVPAGSTTRRTSEPLRGYPGNTRGDSGGARAAIGKPSLVRLVSTAPNPSSESSEEPNPPAHAQTLTLSPSPGSMQIALKPRLSHHTPIPTQHATSNVSHKSAVRHTKSPSVPRLTINIPQKQNEHASTPIDMATSLASPPPTKKTSLPSEKRVTFSREQPEVIPQPSKRRQSSVNQRPSWSNVFLLRESKLRDDVAARSRSLSPGPSILKEISAFKSNASDAELKQDEHGVEKKVHISPLWEKNLKRLPRGRQKTNALPIPQAKVSRNASPRALSPEDASPRDVSPTSLSARYASPREDTFDPSVSEHHSIVVHPPSPPESEDEDDEDAIDDSDESPRHSRNSSLEEVEAIDNRFAKCNIDASSHAHRHEKRKDSGDSRKDSLGFRKDSQSSRKDSQGSLKDSPDSRKDSQDWRESRKSSYGSRRGSQASRKDSNQSDKDSDRPPPSRRRSSSADQAEMWLRKSSIYGVRSKAPRLPTRLGSLRA